MCVCVCVCVMVLPHLVGLHRYTRLRVGLAPLAIYPNLQFTTEGLLSMLHSIPGSRGEGSDPPWPASDKKSDNN